MKKRLTSIAILAVILAVLITGVVFAVNTWQPTHLTVTGTITVKAHGGGGGGGGSITVDGRITLDGKIEPNGTIIDTVYDASTDSLAGLQIPKNTIALDKDGKPLSYVEIEPAKSISPPSGIVGIPYEYTPVGATFNPYITILFQYKQSQFPKGTTPAIQFWDGTTWVSLDNVVIDTINGIVKGDTTHFTVFALVAQANPPITTTSPPTVTPTITPTVTPTQTPTVTPTHTPTITPTQTPTLTPTQTPTQSPTSTPTSQPIKSSNRWIVWLCIGLGIVIIGVVVWRILARKPKHDK